MMRDLAGLYLRILLGLVGKILTFIDMLGITPLMPLTQAVILHLQAYLLEQLVEWLVH